MLYSFWFGLVFVPCGGGIGRTWDYNWRVESQFKISSEYEMIFKVWGKFGITNQLNTEHISSASDCDHQKYQLSRCQSWVVRQKIQLDFFPKFLSKTVHYYCCVIDLFALYYHLHAYTDHRLTDRLMKVCCV